MRYRVRAGSAACECTAASIARESVPVAVTA
jgi:hypothetical protein